MILILPDGSKSLIPADWTDLPSAAQPQKGSSAQTAATLGSLEDLLHARTVVDALLSRIVTPVCEAGNPPAGRRAILREKYPTLFDLLLDETCPWEALHDEHKALVIEILARLIAKATLGNPDKEKDHE